MESLVLYFWLHLWQSLRKELLSQRFQLFSTSKSMNGRLPCGIMAMASLKNTDQQCSHITIRDIYL